MKIKTFNYQDLKGRESVRTCLILSEPTDKVSSIDLSELVEMDQIVFSMEYKKLYDKFLNSVKDLEKAFELNYRFRQFFPDQMHVHEEVEI